MRDNHDNYFRPTRSQFGSLGPISSLWRALTAWSESVGVSGECKLFQQESLRSQLRLQMEEARLDGEARLLRKSTILDHERKFAGLLQALPFMEEQAGFAVLEKFGRYLDNAATARGRLTHYMVASEQPQSEHLLEPYRSEEQVFVAALQRLLERGPQQLSPPIPQVPQQNLRYQEVDRTADQLSELLKRYNHTPQPEADYCQPAPPPPVVPTEATSLPPPLVELLQEALAQDNSRRNGRGNG